MPNKVAQLLITPMFLAGTLAAGYFVQHHPLTGPEPGPVVVGQTYAQSQAAMGIMSEPEAVKWESTSKAILRRKTITEPELSWLLQEIPKPAPSPDSTLGATRRLELMSALDEATTYSPSQKRRIYAATVGYLAGPEPNDKIGSMAVMRHLRDPRAIPGIKPLLVDANPCVRLVAKRTLQAITG